MGTGYFLSDTVTRESRDQTRRGGAGETVARWGPTGPGAAKEPGRGADPTPGKYEGRAERRAHLGGYAQIPSSLQNPGRICSVVPAHPSPHIRCVPCLYELIIGCPLGWLH